MTIMWNTDILGSFSNRLYKETESSDVQMCVVILWSSSCHNFDDTGVQQLATNMYSIMNMSTKVGFLCVILFTLTKGVFLLACKLLIENLVFLKIYFGILNTKCVNDRWSKNVFSYTEIFFTYDERELDIRCGNIK